MANENRGRGPESGKSEWVGRDDPAATDPVSDDEKQGLSVLGGNSIRGGALHGVSDPVRDGSEGPHESPRDELRADGPRRSPEEVSDAGGGDGGLSQSGGRAGGARGHGGASRDVSPAEESRGGPAQFKSTSRMDLDHPGSDVGDRKERR